MVICGLCGTGVAVGQDACPGCGEPVDRMAPAGDGPGSLNVPVVPMIPGDAGGPPSPSDPAAPPHADQAGPTFGPVSVPPGQEVTSADADALAPPPPPPPATGRRRGRGPVALLVVALLAVALGVGGVVLANRSDDPETSATADDDERSSGAAEPEPETEAAESDEAAEIDVTAEPEITCPVEAATPDLVRFWQDDAGIHVVITIVSECEADQVINDPAARFGLYAGAEPLATATFDLSARPIALPAGGTSGEVSLVFDAKATVDHGLRSRVYLPSTEQSAAGDGFDLRYVVVCEPGDGGASSGGVTSEGPAVLDAADVLPAGAEAPIVPPPPDATADGAALAVLEAIHQADAPAREDLRGQWVPQVSAKRLDADATRDVFTGQEMIHTPRVFLDKLRAWEARYADRVILLKGSDFPSICGTAQSAGCLSLWIVAIAEPRATPEEVFFDWCGPEGLNTINGVAITDTTQLNCAAYRYSDDRETPDSFVG